MERADAEVDDADGLGVPVVGKTLDARGGAVEGARVQPHSLYACLTRL